MQSSKKAKRKEARKKKKQNVQKSISMMVYQYAVIEPGKNKKHLDVLSLLVVEIHSCFCHACIFHTKKRISCR